MSESFVSLKNLTLAYGDTVAVSQLSLNIRKGELITLLGPSGCGKTTTMRAIAGLLSPRSGSIEIDGTDVTKVPANKRGVGLVFQSYALFPHLSAFENVAFGLRLRKVSNGEIKQRVEQSLDTVELGELANRKPSELSGGQQQRLSLARSLVLEPKVMLLDEPLSNLDARLRLDMRSELQRLQRNSGITMVFVTHDQGEALALADRVVLMKDGLIEQMGTPTELYNHPSTVFAADFMGFENIFEVREGALIGRDGSKISGYNAPSGSLAWRPSGVSLGSGPFHGTVAGVSFAGEMWEYVITSPLGRITASTPAGNTPYPIGATLAFDLPEQFGHQIKGAG